MITLKTKKWDLTYYTNSVPIRKYVIHLNAISDDTGSFSPFPVTVVETGKPGYEIYTATYPDMTTSKFTSLHDLAFHHSSATEWFEALEDFN